MLSLLLKMPISLKMSARSYSDEYSLVEWALQFVSAKSANGSLKRNAALTADIYKIALLGAFPEGELVKAFLLYSLNIHTLCVLLGKV